MTDTQIYESNLQHFKIKKRYGDKSQCQCPAHDDRHASLTITKGRKCTLFYCHAGCAVDNVLNAARLERKDTFYDVEPRSPNWKSYVETREKRQIEAVYNYVSINGDYAFTKLRLEGKKIIYGKLQNNRFTYGLGDVGRKNYKAIYGSLQAIKKAIAEGKPIFIPEGEKDVNTLIKQGYTAWTYGGCSDWQSDFAALVQGADVYILADNDEAGKRVAETIQNDIKAVAKSSKIIVPMPDTPKADVSDYFAAGHSKQEFEQMIQQEQSTVKETVESATEVSRVSNMLSYKIIYDKDGSEKDRKILQTVRNFEIILEKDRRFAGKIKFNEFSKGIYIIGDVPWQANNNREWDNFDDSALFSLLQSDYGMNNRNDFFDALKNISMRNKFHPVRELLNSLKWDGREHIKKLLPDYLGVEDVEYSYQVMRLQMVGAVKRIFEPACKFDYTVIYTGRQGLGKSTFLRKLALKDQWFNDSLDSLDSDKAAQSLMGSWIIELAELKSLTRTTGGIDSVKRFLSATQDKFRLPYERRTDIFLRQCIFCGTTNRSDFLQDETGNRRFLIIQTGINEPKKSLFSPEATQDIEAAWAEAVHIYKTENPQLILPDSCKEEAQRLQESSMADDGKAGIIAEYLEDKQRICVLELWQKALGEQGRPQKWQASEIINIILSLPEWERMKSPSRFGEYGQQKGFKKMSTKLSTKSSESCLPSNERANGFVPISAESQMELPFD